MPMSVILTSVTSMPSFLAIFKRKAICMSGCRNVSMSTPLRVISVLCLVRLRTDVPAGLLRQKPLPVVVMNLPLGHGTQFVRPSNA